MPKLKKRKFLGPKKRGRRKDGKGTTSCNMTEELTGTALTVKDPRIPQIFTPSIQSDITDTCTPPVVIPPDVTDTCTPPVVIPPDVTDTCTPPVVIPPDVTDTCTPPVVVPLDVTDTCTPLVIIPPDVTDTCTPPVVVPLDVTDTCTPPVVIPPDVTDTCTPPVVIPPDVTDTCTPPVIVPLDVTDTCTPSIANDHNYTSRSCDVSSSFFDHDYVSSRAPEVDFTDSQNERPQEVSKFEKLQDEVQIKVCSPYVPVLRDDEFDILELYKTSGKTTVKLAITIDKTFIATIHVHRRLLSKEHYFWNGLPQTFDTYDKVQQLLNKLNKFAVCIGNPDEEFQDLASVGCGITFGNTSEIHAYREGDFFAELGNFPYNSSIRTMKCEMLVEGRRCKNCSAYRKNLLGRKQRLEDKSLHLKKDLIHSTYKHKDMTREMLICKIQQQQSYMKSLQHTIDKQRRDIDRQILKYGWRMCVYFPKKFLSKT